jgi:arylsulfatase A
MRLAIHFILILGSTGLAHSSFSAPPPEHPNIVLIVADDLGYGDLGCYGGTNKTPRLDALASEGIRFTDFYVAQAVCSASRAAILTGCYPNRIGIQGALGPNSKVGIAENEMTIGELLKPLGYATAFVGKWHQGDAPPFLPTRHGFDSYFGIPYSNDMWPNHPTSGAKFPPLKLIEGEKIIEEMPDQRLITQRYTEQAIKFINQSAKRPFFLELAFAMPHVPLHVSDEFAGSSKQGLYADVLTELDASVGRLIDAVARQGLEERTLFLFTSDNGPWLPYGNHAGSSGGLREGKQSSFEGGVRVPMIARWPGTIPAGSVQHEPTMTIDIFPTIASFTGAELPSHPIDGLDISSLLVAKPGAVSPHQAYFFWWGQELQAVRSGRWKLHFPHEYKVLDGSAGQDGKPGKEAKQLIALSLFDLKTDPNETVDVSASHPDEVARLKLLADAARTELGDTATATVGRSVRSPGRID